MSRCIQECDLLTVNLYYRSTDMLCDTAGLSVCNISFTDGIKQRGLTMVYMSHYTDNRSTLYHVLCSLLIFLKEFFDNIHLNLLLAHNVELDGNVFCLLVADLLIKCNNLTLQEQLLDNNRRLHLHLICQIFNSQNLRDCNYLDLLYRLFLLLRLDESAGFILVLDFNVFIESVLLGSLVL